MLVMVVEENCVWLSMSVIISPVRWRLDGGGEEIEQRLAAEEGMVPVVDVEV